MAEVTGRGEKPRRRRFRAYREYRDSSVESLCEIPSHWSALSIKRVCRLCYGESLAANDRADGDVVVFGSNGPVGTHARANTEAPCLIVGRKGSFGRVNYSARAVFAIDTTFFTDARHTKGDLRWAYYALQCARLDAISRDSAIPGLDREDAYARAIAVGPIHEQRAIADFLDRETATIDALVAKRERLIELLQEKRTALITRAVTRGLDPNVPMKDSGVEWLGEIPAHWKLTPLKRILRRCDYGISESLGGGGDIRVLTMAHVQDGETVLPDDGSIDAVDRTLILESGDLLFNRTNSRELVAKVGIFRGDRQEQVTFASYLVRLTARDNVEPEWLNYLLNSTGLLGMARSMALLSVNQANLNPTKYQRIVVPMPELSEQRRIAGFAKHEATRIDTLVRKIREAIDQLKEFRMAVISAAVTGKIDVREAAPR
ncbi:MAG: restriction endonuclease subunit S [Acidobacteria bacterium]|nr:restriction endonuclease subunit S [Acidobacteriota bacterium]